MIDTWVRFWQDRVAPTLAWRGEQHSKENRADPCWATRERHDNAGAVVTPLDVGDYA